MQDLSTRDINDMLTLIERGVDFRSSRITIPGVIENNCTLIRCAVFKPSSGSTEFSDPVKLTVVGEQNTCIHCTSRDFRLLLVYSPVYTLIHAVLN